MSGLLVVGAGGHGKVVADAAKEQGCWDKIAFVDDLYPGLTECLCWPVLGKIADAEAFLLKFPSIAVAVGNNQLRVSLLKKFSVMGFGLPVIIHPSACVSSQGHIDAGAVVLANAVINAGAKISLGCIVNTAATVDHDCILAEGVHLSPGVHLAGGVTIGAYSWLGIGSSVIQKITIGANVMVGAGAAVTENVANDATVVGVPARVKT